MNDLKEKLIMYSPLLNDLVLVSKGEIIELYKVLKVDFEEFCKTYHLHENDISHLVIKNNK